MNDVERFSSLQLIISSWWFAMRTPRMRKVSRLLDFLHFPYSHETLCQRLRKISMSSLLPLVWYCRRWFKKGFCA